jgi:predicted DCC family thiol-disulfide oxidoreductase YuxK
MAHLITPARRKQQPDDRSKHAPANHLKEEQPMAINQPIGWVLYDDACGFCREWIPFWGPTLHRVGLEIAPLQAPWVGERLNLSPAELVFDIRLLFADGRHLAGAEVYRYAVQQIWWAYPLYLFSVTPGLRWLWDWGYGAFRDHRHQISAACGLPSPAAEGQAESVNPANRARPAGRDSSQT